MMFLRNTWYVAGWSDEVNDQDLFHRKILNEDILFARNANGVIKAMRNRCPHRFAPLSRGERCKDVIECAYHGLQFNLEGECVFNPHGNISSRAKVQAYPVEERHMLVWIWMGNPELSDAALIPALDGLDPERFAINRGYMYTPVNYEYMSDNIMDLGHIEFLHRGLLGSEAVRHAEVDVKHDGNVIHSNRLTRNEVLPPALEALFETDGKPVDRWLDVTWHPPSNMQLVVGVAPTGAQERIGRQTPGVHLMTPETSETTHYFWSNGRDFRLDDTELHKELDAGFKIAFEEQDKPMLIAQRDAVDGENFWDLEPIHLKSDAGGLHARRALSRLIEDEQGTL